MNLEHLTWPTTGWGYMPNTNDALAGFRYVRDNIKPNKILEIGFHVGHSTTYMLELMPEVKVHTLGSSSKEDGLKTPDKRKFRHTMMKRYGDRLECKLRSSHWVMQLFTDQYDFAFIDGNHSEVAATRDIHNCIKMKIPYLLVDNCERKAVSKSCDKFNLDLIETFTYTTEWNSRLDHIEQRLYYVRTNNI